MRANNKRIRSSRFVCNRHPRKCCSQIVHHTTQAEVPCSRHPRLCKWWYADVRPSATQQRKRMDLLLGKGRGLWCQAHMDAIEGPFRIDRRRRCQARYILETMRCWDERPYPYTSTEGASNRLIEHAKKNVQKLWAAAYKLGPAVREMRLWTSQDLQKILNGLDKIFMGSTLRRAMQAQQRDVFIEADTSGHRDTLGGRGGWRRDHPIARVEI